VSIETTVRRVLESLGAPYEIVEIDPAFADTAAFCEKYGYGLDVSGNTIVVASKREPKQFAACLVLANTRLGVTILALPADLPVYVDDRVMTLDYVILGSGSRSSKIKIPPTALERLPGVRRVTDLAQPVG
jgi:prolyl-tRNA editing enzyme YbaK/EbsC (Cys-tRNA(Pro) deacylase)